MQRAGATHPDAGASTSSPRAEEQLPRLYAALQDYLLLEPKFQPRLCLPKESENSEVTIGARDGAAHVLRCLKVWFELPADVLLEAVSLCDRFLTKMKVRPCHLPCITVACMNIAIDMHAQRNGVDRTVTVDELVSISQSACTSRDVTRMSSIVVDKLGVSLSPHVDALACLRLMRTLVAMHAPSERYLPQESQLINLLEIAVCDATCANARPTELALVLLYLQIEQTILEVCKQQDGNVPDEVYDIYNFGAQLQYNCNMSDASLASVRSRLALVISQYEARAAAPHKQRLVWRLSERTLKVLRPTDRLTSLLPTIEEQHFAVDSTPNRNRSGSESSENEETSDWPRSPVLPVYCHTEP